MALRTNRLLMRKCAPFYSRVERASEDVSDSEGPSIRSHSRSSSFTWLQRACSSSSCHSSAAASVPLSESPKRELRIRSVSKVSGRHNPHHPAKKQKKQASLSKLMWWWSSCCSYRNYQYCSIDRSKFSEYDASIDLSIRSTPTGSSNPNFCRKYYDIVYNVVTSSDDIELGRENENCNMTLSMSKFWTSLWGYV